MSTENPTAPAIDTVFEFVQQRDQQFDFERVEYLRKQRVRDGFQRLVPETITGSITNRDGWDG